MFETRTSTPDWATYQAKYVHKFTTSGKLGLDVALVSLWVNSKAFFKLNLKLLNVSGMKRKKKMYGYLLSYKIAIKL